MNVSIVTDEVSSDPETALEIIASWGVKFVEIRGLGDQRFPQVADYWHYRLPHLVREFGVSVAAISPGLFRTIPPGHSRPPMSFTRGGDVSRVRQQLEAERLRDHHIEKLLPASIEAAQQLNTRTIVCFSFGRLDHTEDELVGEDVIQVMRHAAERVAAAGLTLNIEVAEATRRSVDVVRRVNHPALGINWDPANAFNGGEDDVFPRGFDMARPFIRHVHFKDVRFDPGTGSRPWTLENGVMNWPPMLAALEHDGFDGFISVETHFRPKVESTRRTLERLRALIREVRPGPRCILPPIEGEVTADRRQSIIAHEVPSVKPAPNTSRSSQARNGGATLLLTTVQFTLAPSEPPHPRRCRLAAV